MREPAAPPAEVLAGLKSYIDALENASEAMSKLAYGVIVAISEKVEIYSSIQAFEIVLDLIAIREKLASQHSREGALTIDGIEDLIQLAQKFYDSRAIIDEWNSANTRTRQSLHLVKKLFYEINQKRNGLAVKDGYENLLLMLNPVVGKPFPVYKFLSPDYPAALELLSRWGKNYKLLISETNKAIKQFELYIETL